jgi:ribosomal protein L37AE/L43A
MQPTCWVRYTIGQLMLVIAAAAGGLAVPRLSQSPARPVVVSFLWVLATLIVLNAMFEAVFAKVCPACSRRTLRRLARHRHYYRCSVCRARYKRFGFGPWLDASGPEDAARYRKPSEAGIWKGFTVPKDPKGSNSGVLLASKRGRDLLDVIKQHPRKPDSGRRLEQAERKVREFLRRRHDPEDGEPLP